MGGFKTAKPRDWLVADQRLGGIGNPAIMGILNVTPDSFFDGGTHNQQNQSIDHAALLHKQGAHLIDIGGESTRPGAPEVSAKDEWFRIEPALKFCLEQNYLVSIDTTKAEVAQKALQLGAHVINDVSALKADDRMLDVIADHQCAVVLNHMQGTPRSMQNNPSYQDVVLEVRDEILQQADALIRRGIKPEQICLDPGIGFGKNLEHNYRLIGACAEFVEAGFPLMMGTSRKSFIGKTPGLENSDRLLPSLTSNIIARTLGCTVFRVHDVAQMNECFTLQGELEKHLEKYCLENSNA